MFQQMPQGGHLSNSGRIKTYSIKSNSVSSPSDYTDPLYLSETYSKLVNQIHNVKKEIDPLVIILQRLQDQLDPDYSDTSGNIEITQKIASLQAQQYDFDERISQMRRQYSYETKEKLDLELNHYRVILNESRFDLNETNKSIKQTKTELHKINKNSFTDQYILAQRQIKEMNNKLALLREVESDLSQKVLEINNSNNLFSDQINSLSNLLKYTRDKRQKRKTELYKIKIAFENQKKNLIAQIESKIKHENKQQLSTRQDLNLNSNFNSSLRRIVAPSSSRKPSIKENHKKVQIIQNVTNISNSSYNMNTSSSSSRNRTIQQQNLNKSRTPRRNELKQYISHSHRKPSLSISNSPTQAQMAQAILPPSSPSEKLRPRHHKIRLPIADPSVKIVKMQKNDDEFNDFISFS